MSAFHPCVFLVCASLALAAGPVRPVKPVAESVILASASLDDWRYLAFPALHDAGDEVLVSYKRARSHAQDAGAALEEAGFTQVYNVLHGFEGDLDEHHRRNGLNGWRFEGLPWEQC